MELLIGILIVGVVLFFVFGFGAKLGQDAAKNTTNFASHDVRTAKAHDRNNLLNAWRREIANILVWRDPDRYLELYRTLHAEAATYKEWKRGALQTKFDELSKQYPHYEDFDAIGTRLHVLYPDARSWHSDKELEARFADITRFQAILCATDPDWRMFAATSDSDLQHLIKYVAQIKDTKFQLRLERAISDYYVWRASEDNWVEPSEVFEYRNIAVYRVEHFAENRYGVHFKDTNEFALYCFFISDEGRTYYSYYRSDSTFQEEHRLDVLTGAADDYRNRLERAPKSA